MLKIRSRFPKLALGALVLAGLASSATLHAQDRIRRTRGMYGLEAPYKNIRPPVHRAGRMGRPLPPKSNVARMLRNVTPVKSQGSRGTCSIFSATAALEAMMIRNGAPRDLNLSEQWLAYHAVYAQGIEGSNSSTNIDLIRRLGAVTEATLPYEADGWANLTSSTKPLFDQRCGAETGNGLKYCTWAHYSGALMKLSDQQLNDPSHRLYEPKFSSARREADANRRETSRISSNSYIGSIEEVKELLNKDIPVILDASFFYGAWNHRLADQMGIGRDAKAFAMGIIGYPEVGSVDREESRKSPAGHSVLVVGYDDNAVVTTRQKMTDGTVKEFKYKGVYFIKNSWGTDSFGAESRLDGATPGFGVITQKYAHEFASFYKIML